MTRSVFGNVLSLSVLLTSVTLAAQSPVGLPTATVEKVEKAIKAEMARQNIPGLSVAIVKDHQLRWTNGYGMADLENSVPANSATVYRLASVSKPITATAAMQLAERGRLDLDAPVQEYVSSFPQKTWPITTRQLLGHLGGIRHYKNEDEINSTRHYQNLLDPLNIFNSDPLLHKPGTKFSYSTYGYNLLGAVLEGASGMKFVDHVRDYIFRPAGMDRIRVDDVYVIIPNRAQGYRKTLSGELRNSGLADTSNKIPGGGFCGTVVDLARFAIALQTGALVKMQTLEQMFTRQKARDGHETPYGLGWFIREGNGRKEVWHTGGQQRVSTILYLLPGNHFAVALMSNLERASLMELARHIADTVLQE